LHREVIIVDIKKEYYSIKEVAILLGLAEQTIRNYIVDGKIKTTKMLYSTAISKEEVARQLEIRK